MGRFLDRLRQGSTVHRVETAGEGFAIVRVEGQEAGFDDLAREAINDAGGDFLALPITDGHTGYERVVILPTNPGEPVA